MELLAILLNISHKHNWNSLMRFFFQVPGGVFQNGVKSEFNGLIGGY